MLLLPGPKHIAEWTLKGARIQSLPMYSKFVKHSFPGLTVPGPPTVCRIALHRCYLALVVLIFPQTLKSPFTLTVTISEKVLKD